MVMADRRHVVWWGSASIVVPQRERGLLPDAVVAVTFGAAEMPVVEDEIALNVLREAAGGQSLSDEHDDHGG
jgi:hypothetical protein